MERDQALGGTIALLALSGYEADPERLTRAVAYFEARGLDVIVTPDPEERSERFSATDEGRLAALERVVHDERVSIVLGLRGGYGLSRLLGQIDYAAISRSIEERGVRWVGHSDWTALHLAVLRKTGSVTYAGPLAAPDFGVDGRDPYTERQFWDVMDHQALDVSWTCTAPDLQAKGTLWGGNLAMLTSLLATDYFPQIDAGILFLEDINEHPYRVERMLLQLEASGVLGRQQALLLGEFTGYRLSPYDRDYDFEVMVSYLSKRIGIPVIRGLPFGHGLRKATLPVGREILLHCSAGRASLTASDLASVLAQAG